MQSNHFLSSFKWSFLAVVLVAISTFGCKQKLFDYRKKYIGEYEMTEKYHYWQMGGIVFDTIVIYKGKVTMEDKHQMKIADMNGNPIVLDIDKSGAVSRCSKVLGRMNRRNFSFEFDSYTCPGGALGGGYTVEIYGEKVN